MNIEDTLREQLPDLSADVHGGPSLQRALQRGRARRRRRAVSVAVGVAAVCAVGVASATALSGAGLFTEGGGRAAEPAGTARAIPPERMNGAINDAFYAHLPHGVDVPSTIGRAYDANFERLPEPKWRQAANWRTTFRLPRGERVEVSVLHAGSEAEGASDGQCREDVADGLYLHCDHSVHASGADIVRADSADGKGTRRTFERQVEVMPGSGYLIRVEDVVRASTYAEAESRWTLDLRSMSEIATTPDLLDDPAPTAPDRR